MREVVVVSGARTAIGTFGGSLKEIPPTQLGATVVAEALKRAQVAGADVGHVVFGHVINTEPKDMYLGRVAALNGGVGQDTPCLTLNRLCGSGLQAIISAAQTILLGDADIALGGGAECMSRGPYIVPAGRWGQRMGDIKAIDMMVGALHDPFDVIHMGVTAENVAKKWGITRQEQDALAVESHRRAAAATKAGHFKSQIVPVEIKGKKGPVVFDTDEHFREGTSMDDMTKLKPVFVKENGTVTAGNASGINDGGAAFVLMSGTEAAKRGLTPLARIASWATVGVDPAIMGTGPIPASRKALEKAGWKIGDLDLVEANEAFAAQAIAVNKDLGWDPAIVNVNGGAIAIGHPIGASGARVLTTLLHEMGKRGSKKGLATLCIGGGMGVALTVER
jgi:acetyl-CoA C-acetyltransferase